jgi:hypothetical protein
MHNCDANAPFQKTEFRRRKTVRSQNSEHPSSELGLQGAPGRVVVSEATLLRNRCGSEGTSLRATKSAASHDPARSTVRRSTENGKQRGKAAPNAVSTAANWTWLDLAFPRDRLVVLEPTIAGHRFPSSVDVEPSTGDRATSSDVERDRRNPNRKLRAVCTSTRAHTRTHLACRREDDHRAVSDQER